MQINRKEFVNKLVQASVGLSKTEVLEQSNSFIFAHEDIVTFNDELMVRSPFQLGILGAVPANDLLKMLNKFPDDMIDFSIDGTEIRIKGKRKRAGLHYDEEIRLPVNTVERPTVWTAINPEVLAMLQRAAMTCGDDQTQFLTTCVHVTSDIIEGCDNWRLFRATLLTGFPEEVLIPASALRSLKGFPIEELAIGDGWCFFRTKDGVELSVRCSHEPYRLSVDKILEMEHGVELLLPSTLPEILTRASVMMGTGYDALVSVTLEPGMMRLRARKERPAGRLEQE